MALPIPLQLARACAAVLCGAALGLWYDLLRLPRLLLASRAAEAAADLTFCLGAALALFSLGLGPGGGQLRLYMCVCAALGFCLWRAAPGRLLARGQALLAVRLRRAAPQLRARARAAVSRVKKFSKSAKKHLHFKKDGLE